MTAKAVCPAKPMSPSGVTRTAAQSATLCPRMSAESTASLTIVNVKATIPIIARCGSESDRWRNSRLAMIQLAATMIGTSSNTAAVAPSCGAMISVRATPIAKASEKTTTK